MKHSALTLPLLEMLYFSGLSMLADHSHQSHIHQQAAPKRKRSWSRAVFSALQRKGLEKRFEVQRYVTKPDRRQLAAMLGLTDAQVSLIIILNRPDARE